MFSLSPRMLVAVVVPVTFCLGALPAQAAPSSTAGHYVAPDSPQPVTAATSTPASCVPFVGDPIKGYGQVPLGLVAPDYGTKGYDKLPVAKVAELPSHVYFRDNTQGFNQRVEVVLRSGSLFVRMIGQHTWREMPTPSCLRGKIVGMSLNDDALVALDKGGWMYTLSNLQSSPDKWGWIRAWGGPFWFGPGLQSPTTENGKWALSLTGNHTDKTYLDPSGKQQPVSLAKCTQVVALSPDGSRIYSLDPWLAHDYSYEIGTPLDSRFLVDAITASGSVVLVTNKFGDMYTKQADFDINGSDPAQFRYTWQKDNRPAATNAIQHRLDPSTAAIALPPKDWQHQPKIPGTITNRISMISTAPGSQNRELRVEGKRAGQTGYWHKMLNDGTWSFTVTNLPLQGKLLANSAQDRSADTLRAPSPFHYRGQLTTAAGQPIILDIPHFAYASVTRKALLTVGGQRYDILVHSIDGRLGTPLTMRTMPFKGEFGARPAGLVSSIKRNYVGALELPDTVWKAAASNPALASFIKDYMQGQQVHEIFLQVATGEMDIINSPVTGVALPLVSTVSTLKSY